MSKVKLESIIGGALQEKFGKSFEKVIENLQDPETSFKAKRSITIKLTFIQNEARDDCHVDVDITEKLAPQAPMSTQFATGKDLNTGATYAEEYGRQVRGQLKIQDVQPDQHFGEIPCDPETGEVYEDKVIDLRRSAN